MSRMRTRTAEVLPNSYSSLGVRPLDGILKRLGDALRAASPKGPEATLAVLTDGPSDQYYLDHNILAEEPGAVLAERRGLEMEDGYLIHGPTGRRLDVIYERIEEGRIYDDFPDLMHSHAEGKAHAIFPPNADAADDKGIYPFIPDMIRTYLGEEPIIDNARTFSLAVEDDYRYVMDHFDELVIKSRSGWGGKDVLIAPDESKKTSKSSASRSKKTPSNTSPRPSSTSPPTSSAARKKTNSSCVTPMPTTGCRPSAPTLRTSRSSPAPSPASPASAAAWSTSPAAEP